MSRDFVDRTGFSNELMQKALDMIANGSNVTKTAAALDKCKSTLATALLSEKWLSKYLEARSKRAVFRQDDLEDKAREMMSGDKTDVAKFKAYYEFIRWTMICENDKLYNDKKQLDVKVTSLADALDKLGD